MSDAWTGPAAAFPAFPARERLTVAEVLGRSMATIVARAGQETALRKAIEEHYGIALPDGPRREAGAGIAFLGTGPGKWLAVSDAAVTVVLPMGIAAVVDQSGAYAAVTITGPEAETLLARAVAIDIDPRSFVVGSVATTTIEHVGVTIAKTSASPPTFELYVVRSYAGSFAHWLNGAVS